MSDSAASRMTIRLFGPCEVRLHGDPLPRLRSRKTLWLLALLTLRHDREVERSWLAGTLWPDSPEPQALVSLRTSLTDLRRALGEEACRLVNPTAHSLRLDLEGADVDVIAFDAAMQRGDRAAQEEAVGRYQGRLLEGCEEEWVLEERGAREEAYLAALERLAEAALAEGDAGKAVGYLRKAVGADPLRETAQRGLMAALAGGGSTAGALEAYRELREHLRREMNADPDAETRALYDRLRAEARRKVSEGEGRVSAPRRAGEAKRGPVPGAEWAEATGERATSNSAEAALSVSPYVTSPSALRLSSAEATLTFLFTDIEGSTRLWEEYAGVMEAVLARHDALLREAIESQGGHVFKTLGDGFCAAFTAAPRALDAAIAAQRALAAWRVSAPEIRVRMALYTGTVQVREGDYFGPPLNRAQRLLEAGHGGQILVSLATQELVRDRLPEGACLRDLGECRLKDLVRSERIFQLVTEDLPAEFSRLRTLEARPNNLPAQTTPLLGREQEVAALQELLRREEVRLVTLTGAGGTGKTRLAFHVAADLLDDFASGVFFVNLAPITDPGLLSSAIAQVLDVRETAGQPLTETLKEHLREKQMLLLLDNFEQLLAAAPGTAELLAAAPRLKILVTSRATLRIRGEHEFPVPPLPVPPAEAAIVRASSAQEAIDDPPLPERPVLFPSVQLFVDRAAAVRPEFALTDENAPAVGGICRRLDGLPLAIELAAARVKLLTPAAMLTRLGSRLKLLTGGARDLPVRQQTLRDAIAWSYDLLEEREQTLFRRLAVFVDGCTLESAEAVCGEGCRVQGVGGRVSLDPASGTLHPTPYTLHPEDVLDLLASLVDKSLLRQEAVAGDDGIRFRMLETIREFALECLEGSGEVDALQGQHARFFLELAEEVEPRLLGAEQGAWLNRLEREHANLRAALRWVHADQTDRAAGLRLAGALAKFWEMRGHWREGRAWLEGTLEHSGSVTAALEAKAFAGAGTMAWCQGDYQHAEALHARSLAAYREAGDKAGTAFALNNLGSQAHAQGHYERSLTLCEESLALCRELKDARGLCRALGNMGVTSYFQGQFQKAEEYHQECLAIAREAGDPLSTGQSLHNLAEVAEQRGDNEAARNQHQDALRLFREMGEQRGIAACLEGLARVFAAQRRLERAALLFAAAGTHRETIEFPWNPAERAKYEHHVAVVRDGLTQDAFAAAWEAGRAMTLEHAVASALQEDEVPLQ